MFSARKWSVLLAFLSASIANPIVGTANPPFTGGPAFDYRLLVDGRFLPVGGFRVLGVDPAGPGARLLSAGGLVSLESGDTITAINGRPIFQPEDLYRELARSGGCEIPLTVVDCRSGATLSCRVIPARVYRTVPGPVPPPYGSLRPILPPPGYTPQPIRGTAVKALVIGQTNDPGIAASTTVSVRRMREVLSGIALNPQDVQVLSGYDVHAGSILAAVQAMPVGPNDAVFCYYTGHGAYDPRVASGDPAGGHFLQIPRGDLLRKTLRDALLAKGAHLTVLVTDSCNVSSVARPQGSLHSRVTTSGRHSVLESLLRDYTGVVDINGCSHNEIGWGSRDIGGWFTDAFLSTANELAPPVNAPHWHQFLSRVSQKTSVTFAQRRDGMLRRRPYDWNMMQSRDKIARQFDQRPQSFILQVDRER